MARLLGDNFGNLCPGMVGALVGVVVVKTDVVPVGRRSAAPQPSITPSLFDTPSLAHPQFCNLDPLKLKIDPQPS